MIIGFIKGQNFRLTPTPLVVSDTLNYLTAFFVFYTADWDGVEKWTHWEQGETKYDILLKNDKIGEEAHLNLSEGKWKVWIHGNRYSGEKVTQRITTDVSEIIVKASGVMDGEPFATVPASAGEQIIAQARVAATDAEAFAAKAAALEVDSRANAEKASESAKTASDAAEQAEEALAETEKVRDDALQAAVDVSRVVAEAQKAIGEANTATGAATAATRNANNAADGATAATINADKAIEKADNATREATDATEAANTATERANAAAEQAEAAAEAVSERIGCIVFEDAENYVSYLAKFRLIDGKPAIEYTEL